MNSEKEQKIGYQFLKALMYFIFALAFVLLSVFLSSKIQNKNPVEKIEDNRGIVECAPNYLEYQKLIENPENVVNLISTTTPMYAENGEFKSKIVITKIETEKSKVACGYLFIRAGTETNGPLQSWENLYINPNEFGGHINAENNIGPGDSSNYSEYLFSLSKMKYWKTRDDRTKGSLLTADWGVLLNVSKTISFEIGLNTNDKTGSIDRFSIAYKCWDPNTGKENQECKIEILEK